MGLWRCNAGAVRDQQVHHRVAADVDSGRRHHVAKGNGAAGPRAGGDRAGGTLGAAMGAHVPLQLGWRLTVDTAQVAHQDAAGSGATEAPRGVLPLLAVVLLGMDAKVRQCGEAYWTKGEFIFMQLRLCYMTEKYKSLSSS